METVFDYKITEEEARYIGMLEKDFYLKNCTEEDANMDLAALFYVRKDFEKAKFYADKLPVETRLDFWRTVTHP